MADEQGRADEEEQARLLAEIDAALAGEKNEVPPDNRDDPPRPVDALPEDRERRHWGSEVFVPLIGWGLAWGLFALSLIVWPGWRAYWEFVQLILGWASSAP
jgi:hypothetical protein